MAGSPQIGIESVVIELLCRDYSQTPKGCYGHHYDEPGMFVKEWENKNGNPAKKSWVKKASRNKSNSEILAQRVQEVR